MFVNYFDTLKEGCWGVNAFMHKVEGSLENKWKEQHFIHRAIPFSKALCKSICYYVERGGCFKFIGVHFPFPPRTVTLQHLRSSKESPSPVLESFPPLLQKGATILLIRGATSTSQKFAGHFSIRYQPSPKMYSIPPPSKM